MRSGKCTVDRFLFGGLRDAKEVCFYCYLIDTNSLLPPHSASVDAIAEMKASSATDDWHKSSPVVLTTSDLL